MTQDFGEFLRLAIDSDDVKIPADTEAAIASGRRIVRGRRIGWGLGATAVVAAAVLVLPGVLQRPVAGVPAQPAGTVSASPAPADGWLIGTEWSVRRLAGAPIVQGSSMTLKFGDGVVTGFGGCNGFGYGISGTTVDAGWYRQSGDRLTIGQVAATAKGCSPAGITEQETTYFQALTAVQGFTVAGDTLSLLGADHSVLIALDSVPVKLNRTGWQVTSVNGVAPLSERPPTLLFRNSGIHATTGCNGISGSYSQDGDRLTLTRLGRSLMLCENPALMQQENAVAAALDRVASAAVEGGRLHLLDASGAVVLEAIPDAARLLAAEGFTWRLLGANDVTQITLKVDADQLKGKTGCGDYTAHLTRTGNAWTITDVQRKNLLPCANTASAASERFLGLLETVTTVQAPENQLQLMTPDEMLLFTRG